MPKKAFLPKHVMRSLHKWHEDAKTRLKLKVMETYQNQRLARLAITPLNEQYFLRLDDIPHRTDFYSVYLVTFAEGERLCGLHQQGDGVLDALRCV